MAATKFRISIQNKLALVFLFFIAAIAVIMLYSTKKQSLEAMRDDLSKLAVIIASQVDGDALAKIKPGDENTAAYRALHAKLSVFQEAHPDIKYVYTFRQHDDKLVEFVVDPSYGAAEEGEKIGAVYKETTADMLAGFIKPSADRALVADKDGVFLSGYAPVRNSKGGIVGAVGVDMGERVLTEKIYALARPVFIAITFVVLLALLALGYVTMSMIRDIRKLTKEANEISKGNSSETIEINRNDEIGELADSFSRMAASVRILMMNDDDGKKG